MVVDSDERGHTALCVGGMLSRGKRVPRTVEGHDTAKLGFGVPNRERPLASERSLAPAALTGGFIASYRSSPNPPIQLSVVPFVPRLSWTGVPGL